MRAVTIREAKARLNALVEAAERGEQVVLMRGAKHVAAIVPLTAEDLEFSSALTDAQAERFWRDLHRERLEGALTEFESPEDAVEFLRANLKGTRARVRAPEKRVRRPRRG
jgi:prevent-host-death family protein